ncbi:hemolysin family protein [Actinocorallia longicatena]|uniref:Hemolysin family protein n=1 Tax=Actinocorallia longicatena TaxID=111803 RepID=A0ABP6Q5A4_9ACTN
MLEVLLLAAAIGLIALNGLFVAAEFSLITVDRANVEARADLGSKAAGRVLTSLRTLTFQLSGVQLGITVTSLMVGYLAQPSLASLLEGTGWIGDALATALALFIATLTQMLFGELIPKNLAIARPYPVAAAVTTPVQLFAKAGRPVIAFFNGVANRVVRGLGIEPQEELASARSPQELASLARRSAEAGTLPDRVASLVHRTLTFGDRTAGDVMTPRSRMHMLDAEDPVAEMLSQARSHGHSRFPVYRDGPDDIVGIVHIRQAIAVPSDRRRLVRVGDIAVAPARVPETLALEKLFPRMREQNVHLAVVIDEYGGTAGMVTAEDLLEELVGEVRDEHDTDRAPVVQIRSGVWELSGLLRLDEVAEFPGAALPEGPYDTVAGLLVHGLGRLAHLGDTVILDDPASRLTAARMDGRRVDRVILELLP